MDIVFILSIIAIIIAILGIIVTFYVWTHSPDEFKKAIQKLESLFKTPLPPLGKFVKYSIFFLIIGSFMYISIKSQQAIPFNPQIYNTIGFWGLCFLISIAIILTIEQNIENGDRYT